MHQLPVDFFCSNRKNLCQKLEQDDLALIPAGKNIFRFAGITYPFTPNPSFFYFSGICEAECLLLLDACALDKKEILFIPKPSKKKEQWDGKTIDKEQAKKISGINEVEYLDDFFAIFQAKQNWKTKLYIENNNLTTKGSLQFFFGFLQEIKKKNPALELKKLDSHIACLRAKKQPLEIEAIKKAIDITHQSLLKVWNKAFSAKGEKELETELSYQYQMLNASHAFSPIIAGGNNANVLHYVKNNTSLNKKDLLLIDTGASWQNYNADITRVIPLAKKFTDQQKKYYELVLQMQQQVIEIIRPQMTWRELYHQAEEIQAKILKKASIIGSKKEHKLFTVHRIGHALGLDVHDICNQDSPLENGTVLTIEPGLYLPKAGIGIRIEDDFLLTNEGLENLSAKIPKSIEQLESIL